MSPHVWLVEAYFALQRALLCPVCVFFEPSCWAGGGLLRSLENPDTFLVLVVCVCRALMLGWRRPPSRWGEIVRCRCVSFLIFFLAFARARADLDPMPRVLTAAQRSGVLVDLPTRVGGFLAGSPATARVGGFWLTCRRGWGFFFNPMALLSRGGLVLFIWLIRPSSLSHPLIKNQTERGFEPRTFGL